MFWRDTEKNIPILGVRGAGKTYFLLSLGFLVSKRDWGHVVGQGGSIYLEELMPYVSRGEPIPATRGNYPVKIKVHTVQHKDVVQGCDFVVSTEDFSGGEFENAMGQVTTDAGLDTGPTKQFHDLYRSSDGLIVVVDLVRGASEEQFRNSPEEQIMTALSEQVEPLAKGIELILDANNTLNAKPIFLVFTKSDIHGLDVREISQYFDKLMAIPMRRLENRGCEIMKYTTSSVGWTSEETPQALENLEGRGFGEILSDMAHVYD